MRADIQGLRAIAVAAVVVFHLWPGALPGGFTGVDVFFVVSGFLITGRILRDLDRHTVGVFLSRFWAARARRILPAGLVVLAAVLVASRWLLPASQWSEVSKHSLAAALSIENWVLAGDAVDYLAADDAPSPVQHYWSLSVEEQFYLGWPVLLLAAVLLGRRWGRRWPVAAAMGVVVAGGLAYALLATAADPAAAYFVTPARIWQLAAGGLVALAAVRGLPRLPWVGLGLIGAGFVLIDDGTPYPGLAALLPTIGTCLVLLGARTGPRSVDAVSDVAPVQRLGDISYSLYLWHWPLIVLAPYAVDRELRGVENVVLLAFALVLSTLTYLLVENPTRHGSLLRSAPRSLVTGAVAIALVAGATVLLDRAGADRVAAASAALEQRTASGGACIGAAALTAQPAAGCPDPFLAVPPEVGIAAAQDKPSPLRPPACTNSMGAFTELTCTYGDRDAARTLVLWGDSHAASWADAFDVVGRNLGWRVVLVSRQACPASMVSPSSTRYRPVSDTQRRGCTERNAWVVRTWLPRADVVVVAGYTTVYGYGDADPSAGFVAAVEAVRRAGADLVWMTDLPLTGTATERRDIPECLEERGQCTNPVERALATTEALDGVRAAVPDLRVLDSTSRFCDARVCYGAIGGVAVYFDASHITRTYARSLAPWLTGWFRTCHAPDLSGKQPCRS